jgi:DNA-binding NarL/FixJ family response regulator
MHEANGEAFCGEHGSARVGRELPKRDHSENGHNGPQPAVLVSDASTAFAEGLALLLRNHGVRARAAELTSLADACDVSVGVLVVDGDGELTHTAEALARARQRIPHVATAVLVDDTAHRGEPVAAALGASVWLPRSVSPSEFVGSVTRLRDKQCIPLAATTRVSPSEQRRLLVGQLTGREFLVLGLLAKGLSTDAISAAVNISPHTVRTHVQNLLNKLDAHSRAEAVAVARTAGVLDARLTMQSAAEAS